MKVTESADRPRSDASRLLSPDASARPAFLLLRKSRFSLAAIVNLCLSFIEDPLPAQGIQSVVSRRFGPTGFPVRAVPDYPVRGLLSDGPTLTVHFVDV